ncbi:MAG: 3-phenylpropionate/cinnamic acid dioxygenase subunit beta [Actinomycetota bacterium]|nr:3-phenylpropionate/cinnamic acid dioxygenase subunit beta [Actinomycetota bacterium]
MTVAENRKLVSADLHTEVCQFLYREARTLDENRFEDWLQMLTEDVQYEMPLTLTRERAEQARVHEPQMQYLAENIYSLRMRVARLGTEYAWAEDPPSRTRHLVLNVELEPTGDESEVAVHSAFVVYTNRGSAPAWDTLVGRRHDLLVRDAGGWKIRRRTLYLDQAVLASDSISIFL